MSRDCPKGGSSSACFKCKEEGHMSRDCPTGGSSSACFKCKEEGHMSRDCPKGGGSACFKCGEEGHMSRECPKAGEGGGGRSRSPRAGATQATAEPVKPTLDHGLVRFGRFLRMQPRNMKKEEAEVIYKEYKEEYRAKQRDVFFAENLDLAWFKERFDPVLHEKVLQFSHIELALRHARFPYDSSKLVFALFKLPQESSEIILRTTLGQVATFRGLSISEPMESQQFKKMTWALFEKAIPRATSKMLAEYGPVSE